MNSAFYAMLSRMKNINRWNLMRNVRYENLSEHSLEVAFIAHCLAVIGNRRLMKNHNAERIATAALFHDTGEIITGDLPTPIKYYNADIKSAYKEIESVAESRLINMLPEDLREDFYPLFSPEESEKALIKAADKISALIKCTEEINMGNREFVSAEKSTKKAIKDLKCEEADIFMREFFEAFTKNLDELN